MYPFLTCLCEGIYPVASTTFGKSLFFTTAPLFVSLRMDVTRTGSQRPPVGVCSRSWLLRHAENQKDDVRRRKSQRPRPAPTWSANPTAWFRDYCIPWRYQVVCVTPTWCNLVGSRQPKTHRSIYTTSRVRSRVALPFKTTLLIGGLQPHTAQRGNQHPRYTGNYCTTRQVPAVCPRSAMRIPDKTVRTLKNQQVNDGVIWRNQTRGPTRQRADSSVRYPSLHLLTAQYQTSNTNNPKQFVP